MVINVFARRINYGLTEWDESLRGLCLGLQKFVGTLTSEHSFCFGTSSRLANVERLTSQIPSLCIFLGARRPERQKKVLSRPDASSDPMPESLLWSRRVDQNIHVSCSGR